MSQDRTFRTKDVGAYLNVSHQRATQMHGEGKLPVVTRLPLVTAREQNRKARRRSRREAS